MIQERYRELDFHRFLEVLDAKGKLLRLVTQNIDGLDFQTNISPDRICACHEEFVGRAACEGCGAPVRLRRILSEGANLDQGYLRRRRRRALGIVGDAL